MRHLNVFLLIAVFVCVPVYGVGILESRELNKANQLLEEQRPLKALEGYENLLNAGVVDGEVYNNLGQLYFQQQQYEKAQSAFAKAVEKLESPDKKTNAQYNLGNAAFQLGDMETARKAYEKVLLERPDDFDAKYNLEKVLLLLGQLKSSQEENPGQQDPEKEKEKQVGEARQNQQEQQEEDRQEAESIMKSLEQKEKEARENYVKQKAPEPQFVEKDW